VVYTERSHEPKKSTPGGARDRMSICGISRPV
jgi:hypothetical protein